MLNWLKKTFWHPIFKCKVRLNSWYLKTYIIPPYDEKRQIIKEYKVKYGVNVLIETGTFMGDTVAALKNVFSQIYSIELSEELAAKARQRFSNEGHVNIIHGNSGSVMADLLMKIDEPCLLWLDGHYSSEFFVGDTYIKTALGDKQTPILEELEAIFKSVHANKHIILIDDARCFNGKSDYPTIHELKEFVSSFKGKATIEVKRDIIRIVAA